MKLLLEHGRVLSGNTFVQDCPILIEDDTILAVGEVGELPKDTPHLSAQGLTVLPGLVDMHTHGRAGYDFTTATREQMERMKHSYAEHGVTTVFATLASAEKQDWIRAIADIEACGYDGIHLEGRYLNPVKREFATSRPVTTLREALVGADVFLGVSTAGVLDADMVRSMAGNPLVMALANPDPEISYDEAKAARPDVIVATGRTDYPNQVNNVLGFPYIFRGALDVRARKINEAMKLAAAHALAKLAREEVPAELAAAFGVDRLEFGPDYLIPKLTDSRLLGRVAPAVARAAVESGVAQRRPDIE